MYIIKKAIFIKKVSIYSIFTILKHTYLIVNSFIDSAIAKHNIKFSL